MSREILVELKPSDAEAFKRQLRAARVSFDGPDMVKALDAVTLATFIVTVTPVLLPAIEKIIMAIKGTSGTIRTQETTLELKNITADQLRDLLRTRSEGEDKRKSTPKGAVKPKGTSKGEGKTKSR